MLLFISLNNKDKIYLSRKMMDKQYQLIANMAVVDNICSSAAFESLQAI